jgi:ATP-binding cassette subfamily C (CFTR/MRP) protein 4
MKEIAKANVWRLTYYSFSAYLQKISVFLCITIVMTSHSPLTPQYLFPVVVIFDALRFNIYLMSWGIVQFSEFMVSLRRIQKLLLLEPSKEKNFDAVVERYNRTTDTGHGKVFGVCLNNVNAKWDLSLPNNTLSDVSLEVNSSELVAIVGATGSGKSTLLQVILQELEVLSGTLHVKGSVSFAPQEPWIFSGTIRDNILLGEKMDVARYREVINLCCLEHDLSHLSHGDNTMVGERGVKLSGGQKARVNLARAVYRNAEIYLLDDPLSAVDARVASRIFHQCIQSYLKSKCVLLVTHQKQFLQDVNKVLLLENGRVAASGGYDTLQNMINIVESDDSQEISEETAQLAKGDVPSEVDEDQGIGAASCYRKYFLAGHGWTVTGLVFLVFVLTQLVANLFDYFLSFWINISQETTDYDAKIRNFFTDRNCLCICGILIVMLIVLNHLNAWALAVYSKWASTSLHDSLFGKILVGSLTFFDNHSSGRILNRFSKDMGAVDEFIPTYLSGVLKTSLQVSGAVVLILVFDYTMIIATGVFFLLIYIYSRAFKPIISHTNKVEGTSKLLLRK